MRNLIYLVLISLLVLGCSKEDSADPMPTPVAPPPILEIGEMNLEEMDLYWEQAKIKLKNK